MFYRATEKPDPARLFLYLGIPLCGLFLFLTPPWQVADEQVHFLRAYHLSQGHLKAHKLNDQMVGGLMPASIPPAFDELLIPVMHRPEAKLKPAQILKHLHQPLRGRETVFLNFHSTALYPPVAYLPQSVALLFGRLIGLSPVALLYLARLAAAVTAFWLIFLALRITPCFAWGFFTLSLMPMTLFQLASCSADALTTALCFLFIAGLLRVATQERRELERGWFMVLLILAWCVTLAKPAYLVLPALILIIPAARFGSLTRYWGTAAAFLLLSVLPILLWMAWVQDIYIPGRRHEDILLDPQLQLAGLLQDPLAFLHALSATIADQWRHYRDSFIGKLGWLDVVLPPWLILTYVWLLPFVAVFLKQEQNPRLSARQLAVLLGVFGLNLLQIFTMMYLSWSAVGADRIEGVQGRYFIPLAPLLLIVLSRFPILPALEIKRKTARLVCLVIVISALVALKAVVQRYYF